MRHPCAAEGCEVGASREGFCGTHAPDRHLRQPMPIGPLLAAVRERGGLAQVGCAPGSNLYRRFFQAKYRGKLTPEAADRMAFDLLACHPCEIWPEWWGVNA